MPVVLAYAAVALTGLVVAGYLANKIASHFDGSAASEAYSKALLQREKSLLALHEAGYSTKDAASQLGPAPKMPKGIGIGGASLLIGSGIVLAAGAIFWKPLSRFASGFLVRKAA